MKERFKIEKKQRSVIYKEIMKLLKKLKINKEKQRKRGNYITL